MSAMKPGLLLVLALGLLPLACRTDQGDVGWLEQRSMLFQAGAQSAMVSGQGEQWRHRYGDPQPQQAVQAASVWLLHYPGSVIVAPGQSVIGSWADPRLWEVLRDLGVNMLHTCPVKRSGGLEGRRYTPTVDGWFDRISFEIDPQLGTEEEYRRLVRVADEHGGSIAGDLVPLHTGMGADFRLAERAYRDYPGAFTMVEIRREDWPGLPPVSDPWATALVPRETAAALVRKGYLPGLIDSADASPEAKHWSGWSATGEVTGVDGKTRRWVYLHVFKPQQPALDWLDPSYAARRMVAGDAVRSIRDLGDRMLRLDAVPFLGIEPKPPGPGALYFQHPLSVVGTEDLAFMVRKLGGWTFQELNVPIDEFKRFAAHGPDLSYDFFTRAQVLHPLITGDAGPLRVAQRLLLENHVPAGTLIHDLQNHDEITYQLVDLGSRETESFTVGGRQVTGKELKLQMLAEMQARAAGPRAPWNKLYRPERDGVAATFAGFIAAALGVRDPYRATPEDVERIRRAHLLLAHANAMQPGVFALSSWDLVGALPLPNASVADRTSEGDYRWVNRGGVDLLGAAPAIERSAFGLPRAPALYGALPEQLRSPDSFASRLRQMLAGRKQYRIAEAEIVAVPEPHDRAVCVLVMRLPGDGGMAVTALNYGSAATSVDVDVVPASLSGEAWRARDAVTGQDAGATTRDGKVAVKLEPLSGRTIVLRPRW
jgi:trehalose synthase